MRLPKRNIVALLVALLGLAGFVLAARKPAPPVSLNVRSVTEGADAKRVTIELVRLEPGAFHAVTNAMRVRIAGQWQPVPTIPDLEDTYWFTGTNRQLLVFDVPHRAEACGLSLDYRVGPRPYCQAYFFLTKHGISQKFPALSRAILRCVPDQPRLRHFECELQFPAGRQEGRAPVSHGPAGLERLTATDTSVGRPASGTGIFSPGHRQAEGVGMALRDTRRALPSPDLK